MTPGDVPAGKNDPINEGIVEYSTHEVAQQAPANVSNIEQSINRLAQIVTMVVQNQTHLHVGHANTIKRVRNLGERVLMALEILPKQSHGLSS